MAKIIATGIHICNRITVEVTKEDGTLVITMCGLELPELQKDFDECMKTSIITAIRYDLEIVGVQIIASENGRKRTTDYYIGDVAAVDAEGRPSRVRIGQFSYGAGDFRSYADVGSRKHSIEICSGRVSLAKRCAKILELPYIFPLEETTKREVPKMKIKKR